MFLCAVVSLFAGCDKEESPFEGSDAHILSFSLTTTDGVKFRFQERRRSTNCAKMQA